MIFSLDKTKIELLNQWIGKECEFRLLYRGSRDGFTGLAFHEKVDY